MGDVDHLTFLGSALFTRRVSGPRVVLCSPPPEPPLNSQEAPEPHEEAAAGESVPAPAKVKGKYRKTIDGVAFESYGAHTDTYQCCYLTAACALGATREEMDEFLARFEKALQD